MTNNNRDVARYNTNDARPLWAVYCVETWRVLGVWSSYEEAVADAETPRPTDAKPDNGPWAPVRCICGTPANADFVHTSGSCFRRPAMAGGAR